ncbi:hypothetical protein WJX72_003958 [[Myrmecia] bisecta]|uniref:Uncharacterized protein n=1 Tax=[Myrmecia] bisecta TaxID=41462 RepID=A0AAW1QFD1_9CHLO
MTAQIFLDETYLVPRLVGWVMLLAVAVADGCLHRNVRVKGWQLHRGVTLVIAAYVVQDVLLTTYTFAAKHPSSFSSGVFEAYIFFTDLADSLFIGLLLLIAAGYCITRDNLGPYRSKVLGIPIVYFVTTLTVDYIINAVQGKIAFETTNPEADLATPDTFSGWEFFILNICEVASLVALLLAWVYIFDTVQHERELLEQPREGYVGSVRRDEEAGQGETGAGGHAVQLPQEVLEANAGGDLHDVYAEVTGNDADAPKTVQDRLVHRSKIRLMQQFMWGVGTYVIATAVVILLPLFVVNTPGEDALVVVLVAQNVVLWGLLAALCYIFRLREDSPYLLLEEDSPETVTGLDSLADDPSLEMGSLSLGPVAPHTPDSKRYGDLERGNDTPVSINRNYSLGEDDDEFRVTPKAVEKQRASEAKGTAVLIDKLRGDSASDKQA